jgi:hypothetical protein
MKITDVIDINQVAKDMFKAVADSLNKDIPDTAQFGTGALQDYIKNIAQIKADLESRAYTNEVADGLMKDASLNLKMAAETEYGLAKITAQNAINAAIDVLNAALKTALNTAVNVVNPII